MDARRTLIFVTTVLMCGYVTSQIADPAPTNVPSDPATHCLTAKSVSGVCVPRQGCDYGTAAVDLTLYATRNYTRPCALEEVCCPLLAMVHVETPSSPTLIDSDEDEF